MMAAVRQALRFALDPNSQQRRCLARHAGAARFAYKLGAGAGEGRPRRPPGG